MNNTLKRVKKINNEYQLLKSNEFITSFLYSNLNLFLEKCNLIIYELETLKDNINITVNTTYEANYNNTLDGLNKAKENIGYYNKELKLDKSSILLIAEQLYDEYIVLFKKHQNDFDNYYENASSYLNKYYKVSDQIGNLNKDFINNKEKINILKSNLNSYKTRFDSCIKNMNNINKQIEDLLEKGLKNK